MTREKVERIQFTTRDAVDSIEIGYDPESGKLFPVTAAADAFVERSYSRKKGDKVVSRIPLAESSFQFGRDRALWDHYDYLVSVDTNTREILGVRVSICVVMQAVKMYLGTSKGLIEKYWSCSSPFTAEFTDAQESPERIGWGLAIDQMRRAGIEQRFHRIGIVVDAHLDELMAMNKAERPVIHNWVLPAQFILIYASAERGRDDFANKLMSMTDKCCNQVFQHVGTTWSYPHGSETVPGTPFETLRHIRILNGAPFGRPPERPAG